MAQPCPKCGESLAMLTKYCPHCGFKLKLTPKARKDSDPKPDKNPLPPGWGKAWQEGYRKY